MFLYFRGKTTAAFRVLSILAFALALSVIFEFSSYELPQFRIGYYVWLSGHFLLAVASAGELCQQFYRRAASKRLYWKVFMLLVSLVTAGMAAVVAIPINRAHQQQKAVSEIESLNGQVIYDAASQTPTSSRLRWFVRSISGVDISKYVVRANVGGTGKSVDDSNLQALASLHRLESLSLNNAQISGLGTEVLSTLRSLKFLSISNSMVVDGTFERLKRCPALCELSLGSIPLSKNLLQELASLHSVRVYLSITSTLSTEEMSTLAAAQNIHALSFDRVSIPPETWIPMGRIGGLRNLNFSGMSLPDSAFEAIGHQTQLHTLFMREVRATDDAWAKMPRVPTLRRLNFSGMSLPDSAFEMIGRQTQLHVLSMQDVRATDDAWTKMPRVPTLRELMLHKMTLSVSACAAIGRQRQLDYLNLNDTSIADGGLTSVKHLKDLRTLALHRTGVTSKDLRQLHELRQLVRLELHATKVSDEICDALRQIASLRKLNLTHTLVSRKAADQLRADLPDCLVEY